MTAVSDRVLMPTLGSAIHHAVEDEVEVNREQSLRSRSGRLEDSMNQRLKLCIGFAMLAMCSAFAENARTPPWAPVAKSVDDTTLVCGKDAPECRIIVRVEPSGKSCAAIVDIHDVKIAKNKLVKFMLVRSMGDTHNYRFNGEGIQWVGTPPPANEIAFKMPLTDTVAQWMTGTRKSTQGLKYVPTVLRDDNQLCGAGDPTIANDG